MPCACDGTFKQDSMAYQYVCAGVQFLQKPECSQVLFIWAEWKLPMWGRKYYCGAIILGKCEAIINHQMLIRASSSHLLQKKGHIYLYVDVYTV